MFSLLEERGYKRWEIGKLDPGYVNRVIGYPRNEKGQLEDDTAINPAEDNRTVRDKVIETLRGRGWSNWKIRDYLREMYVKQMEESQRIEQEHMMEQERAHGQGPWSRDGGPDSPFDADGFPTS